MKLTNKYEYSKQHDDAEHNDKYRHDEAKNELADDEANGVKNHATRESKLISGSSSML